jgi:opacity protein-like surface antigen
MRIAVCLIMALAVASSARGVDLSSRALDYGVREIGISGGYFHQADTESHSFELKLRGGRMTGAGMEFELEGGWQRNWDDDSSHNLFTGVVNFMYNVRTYTSWAPFFLGGGGLAYDRISGDDFTESWTDGLINFGGGTKLFFTREVALRLEYRYKIQFRDPDDITTHHILFGLSAFLP